MLRLTRFARTIIEIRDADEGGEAGRQETTDGYIESRSGLIDGVISHGHCS